MIDQLRKPKLRASYRPNQLGPVMPTHFIHILYRSWRNWLEKLDDETCNKPEHTGFLLVLLACTCSTEYITDAYYTLSRTELQNKKSSQVLYLYGVGLSNKLPACTLARTASHDTSCIRIHSTSSSKAWFSIA